MDQKQIVADLECRARELGVPMYLVCERAGIAASTYYRWVKGTPANIARLNKVSTALDKLQAEQAP